MCDGRQALGASVRERPVVITTRSLRTHVWTRCARPDRLMRRACSRAAVRARSLDVCLDSRGPFIDVLWTAVGAAVAIADRTPDASSRALVNHESLSAETKTRKLKKFLRDLEDGLMPGNGR